MSEWISVKDKLPEIKRLVLVCNPRSIPTTYGMLINNAPSWAINDEPDYSMCKIDRVSFVTHWQPFPAPPKVKHEE